MDLNGPPLDPAIPATTPLPEGWTCYDKGDRYIAPCWGCWARFDYYDAEGHLRYQAPYDNEGSRQRCVAINAGGPLRRVW